ncbi:hypothetical protein N879_13935 [Alcaligenes sp. EGD-AK7]|nr:hypothetical protein N879_13935 [Alcaligenes sp. EGD-AK7]
MVYQLSSGHFVLETALRLERAFIPDLLPAAYEGMLFTSSLSVVITANADGREIPLQHVIHQFVRVETDKGKAFGFALFGLL